MTSTESLAHLSSLLKRARELADRWINAIRPGYPKGYVHATDLRIEPETQLITFRAYYVDGGALYGPYESISTRYLDDDSTLEQDAKIWKAAEDARQDAVRARIEDLKARPDVKEYLSLATHESQRWAHPQGYLHGGIAAYPLHALLKETPKL